VCTKEWTGGNMCETVLKKNKSIYYNDYLGYTYDLPRFNDEETLKKHLTELISKIEKREFGTGVTQEPLIAQNETELENLVAAVIDAEYEKTKP